MSIKKYSGNELSHIRKIDKTNTVKNLKFPETSLVEIEQNTVDGIKKIDSTKPSEKYSPTYSGNIFFGRVNNFALEGPSAYDVAVRNGFVGTEEEWLDSLVVTANNSSGWVWIKESTYDSDNPFVIDPDTLTKIDISRDLVLSSGVNQEIIDAWDDSTNTFVGAVNERYEIEVTTFVSSTISNQDFSLSIVSESNDSILKGDRTTLPNSAGLTKRLTFQFDVFIGPILIPDGFYFGIFSEQTLRIWETSVQIHRSYAP